MRDPIQSKHNRGFKRHEFNSYEKLLEFGVDNFNNLDPGIGIVFNYPKFLSHFFDNINLSERIITFQLGTFECGEKFNFNASFIEFDRCNFEEKPDYGIIFSEELIELSFYQCRGHNIYYNGNGTIKELKVIDCNFQSLFLGGCRICNLYISGPNRFTNLEILSGEIEKIYIEATIENILKIEEIINHQIILQKVICEEISIILSKVDTVSLNYVESIKFAFSLSQYSVKDPVIKKFSVVSCRFQNFSAHASLWRMEQQIIEFFISDSSNIRLVGMDIQHLILNNTINFFEVTNCKLLSLSFNSFKINNDVSFNNIQFSENDSEMNLVHASLKNVTISPSFLHTIKKIKFDKSSIQGMNISNLIDIPEDIINPKIRDNKTQYLTLYRELKSLAQFHNNNYLVQRFKALEYNELLDDKSQDIKFGDKIILKANKWSNNHGTKPFYALGWIILLIVVYAGILSVFYDKGKYSNYAFFLSENYTYLFTPFKFLNELNIVSNLTGIYFVDLTLVIFLYIFDLLYKLTIGYLIYQLIFAFRKFNS